MPAQSVFYSMGCDNFRFLRTALPVCSGVTGDSLRTQLLLSAEHGEVSGRPIKMLQPLHGDEEQFNRLGREDRLIMVDIRGIVFPRQQERA